MPLISPGDIIIGSLRHYRRNVRAYGEFAVWFGLLAVASWAVDRVVITTIADKTVRLFTYLAFLIPLGLAAFTLTTGLMDHVSRTLRGRTASVRHSLLEGAHKLLPFIWAGFLSGLAIFGWTLLLIIPGLIAMVHYHFVGYAVVEDERHGAAALSMSRKAVRNRFWAVLGRLILTTIALSLLAKLASSVIYLVFGAAVGNPGLFFTAQSATTITSDGTSLLVETVQRVVYALTLPLFFAADLILWHDLKRHL